jgi:DNA-binding GntR family transcriptional regulator
MSYAELAENYRIRELLETEAIKRSVPVIGKQEIARMREAIHDMERSHRTDDLPGLTAANRRFHFTLFDTAGMPRMADIIRILWDQSDRYRSVYFSTKSHRRRVNSEHRAIMTAVREQKIDLAVELLRDHREHALQSLQPTLLAAQESNRTVEL